MVGNEDWNGEKFKVIQKGSHSWSGTVIVWKGNSKTGAHGRRNSKSRPGQWASRDSIKLKSCAGKGKKYFDNFIANTLFSYNRIN